MSEVKEVKSKEIKDDILIIESDKIKIMYPENI
jgi:hypothetical protein